MTERNTPVNREAKQQRDNYVKLQRSIWTDPDFTTLSQRAQWAYLMLISQPDITHVGVVPYMPARWVRLSVSATLESTVSATVELIERGYIVVDEETGELWVRSYVIYDRAWKLTNGPKSLMAAHAKVYSPRLRNLIRDVLATVDVTVDVTVESTVDVTVSAHKTRDSEKEAAPAALTVVPSKPHALRRKVLLAAAAEIIRKQGTRADNPTGLAIRVADRLNSTYGALADAWIEEHGEEEATAMVVAADTGRPVATDQVDYAPDPEVALRPARAFGRSVKQSHLDNYTENEQQYMRESFINELPYEARHARDKDAWAQAALEAYDAYAPQAVSA